MYADPQAVTISGATSTLPRVPSPNPNTIGRFASADGNVAITVHQNQTKSRFRREIRLTQRKIAADPLTATNSEVSASVMVVIDEPKAGFTDAELVALFSGVVAYATASTNAKVLQLLGGEQ